MENLSTNSRWQLDISLLEHGDIYFFYKPKKEVEEVTGFNDVSRFFIVLDPQGEDPARYIVMGNKKMPMLSDGGKTTWGFIQIVGGRGFKAVKTVTPNRIKNASRPAGEGIYAIINHRDHTHLLYSLELPRALGPVQLAFDIKKEANYIILGRGVDKSPNSPEEPFSNFSKIDKSTLNKRGSEVLIVGVGTDIGRLGIKAKRDYETLNTADIFSKLEVDRDRHPTEALISGRWN